MIEMRKITKSYEMGAQVVHALRGVDLGTVALSVGFAGSVGIIFGI